MKRCFLRSTDIELLDGSVYKFRALPFTDQTVALMDCLTGGGERDARFLKLLRESIALSLSFDQADEVVDELFQSGAIPFLPGGPDDRETAVYNKILGSMVAQFKQGG